MESVPLSSHIAHKIHQHATPYRQRKHHIPVQFDIFPSVYGTVGARHREVVSHRQEEDINASALAYSFR